MSYEPGYSDFRDVIVADGKWTEQEFGDYLASRDTEVARAAKVEALREAADEWTHGAWADDMAPGNDRPALILGTSQRAANFLRTRADRIEAGEGA